MRNIARCWLSMADVDGEPTCTGLRLNEPGGPPFDAGFEWVEFVNADTYRGGVERAYEQGFWDGSRARAEADVILPENWKDDAHHTGGQ